MGWIISIYNKFLRFDFFRFSILYPVLFFHLYLFIDSLGFREMIVTQIQIQGNVLTQFYFRIHFCLCVLILLPKHQNDKSFEVKRDNTSSQYIIELTESAIKCIFKNFCYD